MWEWIVNNFGAVAWSLFFLLLIICYIDNLISSAYKRRHDKAKAKRQEQIDAPSIHILMEQKAVLASIQFERQSLVDDLEQLKHNQHILAEIKFNNEQLKEKQDFICKFNSDKKLLYDLEQSRILLAQEQKQNSEVLLLEQKHLAYVSDMLAKIITEQTSCSPWLSEMLADFNDMQNEKRATCLEIKSRPALSAAEEVRRISKEKREINKEMLLYKYQLNAYEKLFPWLENYRELNSTDIKTLAALENESTSEYESLKTWISPEEYKKLETTVKFQLALDRSRKSTHKSSWQVGIDFERYIGYFFERDSYKVRFSGALDGLEDKGRDIIARRNGHTKIVQCKYWRKEKVIHEKHIFQLYGSVISFQLRELNKEDDPTLVKGVFVTTASLSDFARECAVALGIEVRENFVFDHTYPCIKCNINQRSGEKIYHLPFDQQYDRITVELAKGECYCSTVEEAVSLGFRRAFKWRSTNVT